jgi:hypothetical protein
MDQIRLVCRRTKKNDQGGKVRPPATTGLTIQCQAWMIVVSTHKNDVTKEQRSNGEEPCFSGLGRWLMTKRLWVHTPVLYTGWM